MSLLWLLAGILLGLFNALTMAATVRGPVPTTANRLYWIIGGMVARWVWTAALLIVALRQSAGAGLAAFAGLWLARWVAIAWWSKVSTPCARRPKGEQQEATSWEL